MRSIIAPVNFSNNSSNAARYAADLALAIGGQLHLIYVLQLPVNISDVPIPDYVFEEMQRSGQILLDSLAEELTKRTGGKIKVTTDMEVGGVEYKLEEFCQRLNPFVVVMGVSGHTLENVMTGSSTVRAMRNLPYPLLIIPEKAVFHAVKKILLAYELEDIGAGLPESMPFLKELEELFESRFEVVNVRAHDVSEGIKTYLEDHSADWLMVFPKKHNFFEFHNSQSKKIVKDCPVPVMSVHA